MSADLGYVVENVDSLQHQPVVHLPPCYAKKLAIKKNTVFTTVILELKLWNLFR